MTIWKRHPLAAIRYQIIYWADTGGNDAYGWKDEHFHESGPAFGTYDAAERDAIRHLDTRHVLDRAVRAEDTT